MTEEHSNRRDAIKKAALAASVGAISSAADPVQAQDAESRLQPESFWRERMTPPDDGKQLGWFIDTRRCFGCHACEVSCKAENDVPLGNFIRQTLTRDVGEYPKVARAFLPMACQHCEDAPCIKACPCGALHKGVGGSVLVDYNTCCGHGTCIEVCPYGALYMDPVGRQAVKCHNCYHRAESDMQPACVPTCPSKAIFFGDLKDDQSEVRQAMRHAEEEDGPLKQLRPEKGTRPRMWFAGSGPVELEEKVPGEGESYHPEAYNIHRWKERPS